METIYNRLVAQVINNKSNTKEREALIKPILYGLCMIALIGVSFYVLSKSFIAFLILGGIVLICVSIAIAYNKLSDLAIDIDIEDIMLELEKDWK